MIEEEWITTDNVVKLQGYYHENQLWLPFENVGFCYRREVKQPYEVKKHAPKSIKKKRIDRKMTPTAWSEFFTCEEGVHQHILPLDRFMNITRGVFLKLSNAGFPAFERCEGGAILVVKFKSRQQMDHLKQWCKNNCVGRYYIDYGEVILEKKTDWVKVKLFI